MQKKSNLEKNNTQGGIVIKLSDLNSKESIKNWITKDLKYNDPNLSDEDIKSAVEGIIMDPLFISSPDSKKQKFIQQITKLIKTL
jgi:hypothetical protein